MTEASPKLAGGCHCGAIRFSIATDTVDFAGYCHCSICRRLSGAPVTAWIAIADGGYQLTAGTPTAYRSSDHGSREFCPRCGSQLLFRGNDGTLTVSTTALDDAEVAAVRPRIHIYTADRLGWFDTTDTLPRAAALPHDD
jgi:hypothetical protein